MSIQFSKPLLCNSDLFQCLVWDLDGDLYLLVLFSQTSVLCITINFMGLLLEFLPWYCMVRWESSSLVLGPESWGLVTGSPAHFRACLGLGINDKRTQRKKQWGWPHSFWTTVSPIKEKNASLRILAPTGSWIYSLGSRVWIEKKLWIYVLFEHWELPFLFHEPVLEGFSWSALEYVPWWLVSFVLIGWWVVEGGNTTSDFWSSLICLLLFPFQSPQIAAPYILFTFYSL